MALRLSRFSSPFSRVFARNARNFWSENYTFGDQVRRRTACIFGLELSNGSSSKKLILSVLCFRYVFVDFFQLIFWTTCQIRKKGKRRKNLGIMFFSAELLILECSWTITWQLIALPAIISSIPWSREQKLFVFPSPWSTGCKLWFISLWFNWTFYINLKKLEKCFWRSYLGLYRTDRLVSLTLLILTFLQFPPTHLLLFFLLILANNCSFLVRPSRRWMGRLSPNCVCW